MAGRWRRRASVLKGKPQSIDDRRAEDQKNVGGSGRMKEVGIKSSGQRVNSIANTGRGQLSRAQERLRPEPNSQSDHRDDQAEKQAAPVARFFSDGHRAESCPPSE